MIIEVLDRPSGRWSIGCTPNRTVPQTFYGYLIHNGQFATGTFDGDTVEAVRIAGYHVIAQREQQIGTSTAEDVTSDDVDAVSTVE